MTSGEYLLPVDQWTGPLDTDGVFKLYDPVLLGYQKPMPNNPNLPPAFLLRDERMKIGQRVLAAESSDVVLDLWLTAGEASPADLGDENMEIFERVLLRDRDDRGMDISVKAVGHTIDGIEPEVEHELFCRANELAMAGVSNEHCGVSPYHSRLIGAVVNAQVLHFSAGIEPVSSLKTVEHTIATMDDMVKVHRAVRGNENAEAEVAGLIVRDAKQWYRVLMTGYKLHTLKPITDRAGVPLDNVVEAAPVSELDYKRKYEKAGVKRIYGEVAVPGSDNDQDVTDEQIMKNGYVRPDQLKC